MKAQTLVCLSLWLTGATVSSYLEGRQIEPIVGGQNADKNEYPWQIYMRYDGEAGRLFCGGSIINALTVMTAAHCVDFDPMQSSGRFWVVAGEWDLFVAEGTEQIKNISYIRMHNKFNTNSLRNDIALLILDSALTYTSSVQPVDTLSTCSFDNQAVSSSRCVISGWGVYDQDPQYINPHIMQELVPTNVVTNKYCKTALPKYTVSRNMICAVDTDAGICFGDSGGPMGCFDNNGTFHQVGIASWIPESNCSLGVQAYTRVSAYLDWIAENQA